MKPAQDQGINNDQVTHEALNTLKNQIECKIERHGFTVISFPIDDGDAILSHTIGLAQRGWPEMILSSLCPNKAVMIFHELVKKLSADKQTPSAGMIVTEALNFPIKIQPVSAYNRAQYLKIATLRARVRCYEPVASSFIDCIPAVQVVWPDESGKYPGDKGYDESNFPQQLLDD